MAVVVESPKLKSEREFGIEVRNKAKIINEIDPS